MPSSPGTNLPSFLTPTYFLALIVSMCSAWVASVPNKKKYFQIYIKCEARNIKQSYRPNAHLLDTIMHYNINII